MKIFTVGFRSLFCAMLFSLNAGNATAIDVKSGAGRERWAYPSAVIVTQDGGKVSEPAADSTETKTSGTSGDPSKKRDEERQFHTVPRESPTEKALREAAVVAEKDLLSCAESLRSRIPETVLAQPTISLRLIMPIAADGTVAFVDYEGRAIPPYFIECTSKNKVAATNSMRLKKNGRRLNVSIQSGSVAAPRVSASHPMNGARSAL